MTNFNNTFNWHLSKRERSKSTRTTRAILVVISWYQSLHSGRVAPCRFYPSCSNYAYEAIETHGAPRGSLLALRRLLKCRPGGPHGIDLVPNVQKDRTNTP